MLLFFLLDQVKYLLKKALPHHHPRSAVAILWMICAFNPCALSLDESSLWLPASYQRHYSDLKMAAENVERRSRCRKVLRGTVDLDQSTSDRTVFRILCRQDNGKTYHEMIDADAMLSESDNELLNNALTDNSETEKLVLWKRCESAFMEKTKAFLNTVILNPNPDLQPSSRPKFRILFNAESIDGEALKYLAVCEIGEHVSVRIRPRHS